MADLTKEQIISHLAHLGKQLEESVNLLKAAEYDYAVKQFKADATYAANYLNTVGTVEERKRRAFIQSADELKSASVAEAHVKYVRVLVRSIETRVEIGRSYNAALRAEIELL